jgi:hypothetical protein
MKYGMIHLPTQMMKINARVKTSKLHVASHSNALPMMHWNGISSKFVLNTAKIFQISARIGG